MYCTPQFFQNSCRFIYRNQNVRWSFEPFSHSPVFVTYTDQAILFNLTILIMLNEECKLRTDLHTLIVFPTFFRLYVQIWRKIYWQRLAGLRVTSSSHHPITIWSPELITLLWYRQEKLWQEGGRIETTPLMIVKAYYRYVQLTDTETRITLLLEKFVLQMGRGLWQSVRYIITLLKISHRKHQSKVIKE
jgi:hypothetical protein